MMARERGMNVRSINDVNVEKIAERNERIAVRQFIVESCELAKCLPPRERILFLMRFDHGYSIEEIASLCKASNATVRRRLGKIARHIDFMRKCCDKPGQSRGTALTKDIRGQEGQDGKINQGTRTSDERNFHGRDNRRFPFKKQDIIRTIP